MRKRYRLFVGVLIVHLSFSISAQVPVKAEPRHKMVLENKWVRVLDVNITPGDTSLFHIHQTPSAFIIFTSTLVGSQVFHGESNENKSEVGTAWYNEFEKPLTHRVWNADRSTFHVMDIELLSSDDTVLSKILSYSGLTLVNDERKIRIYRFQLATSENLKLKQLEKPILIFPVKGKIKVDSKNEIELGQYKFMDKGKSVAISNSGNENVQGFVFQLK